MRILYLSILPVLDQALGVLKKIENQTENMINYGVDVDVAIFFKDRSASINFNDFQDNIKFFQYPYGGLRRPIQLFDLWEQITNLSEKSYYDLVYFRYPGASYFLYRLLRRNPQKIILEHNTKELDEYKLTSNNPLKIFQEKYYSKKSFKYALGNVGKSSDCSEHQEYKVGYKLNLKTITNGVSVSKIEKVKTKRLNIEHDHVTLIFVGNTAHWHGLERFFEGLVLYNDKIEYKLLLVGKEAKFIHLINQYRLNYLINDKIFLTGFKTGKELDVLFNEAHFAIGSLGLHRLNIGKGCPLKHREYMARGIPFIFSGQDDDIHSDITPFLFNIKANEEPIEIFELFKFIINLYNKESNIEKKLVEYAYKNMDMKIKSKELIDYFQERIMYKNTHEN